MKRHNAFVVGATVFVTAMLAGHTAAHAFEMELQKASLKFVKPGEDSFAFEAEFDPATTNGGIDPEREEVTIIFGSFRKVLRVGAFVCDRSDCVHTSEDGTIHAMITPGFLEFKADHVSLFGTANPHTISVQIGDDSATAPALFTGKLKLLACGIGFELVFLLPPLMWLYGRRPRRKV